MTPSSMPFFTTTLASPVGRLRLFVDARARLVRLDLPGPAPAPLAAATDDGACRFAAVQLEEYFAGRRRAFDLELELDGTPFQRRVWEELRRIPYGTTISYGELAHRIGKPAAMRAVGAANGRNRIPIVVPCHRVIGADGALTGFGGGLPCKRALLQLEGVAVAAAENRVLPFAGMTSA